MSQLMTRKIALESHQNVCQFCKRLCSRSWNEASFSMWLDMQRTQRLLKKATFFHKYCHTASLKTSFSYSDQRPSERQELVNGVHRPIYVWCWLWSQSGSRARCSRVFMTVQLTITWYINKFIFLCFAFGIMQTFLESLWRSIHDLNISGYTNSRRLWSSSTGANNRAYIPLLLYWNISGFLIDWNRK